MADISVAVLDRIRLVASEDSLNPRKVCWRTWRFRDAIYSLVGEAIPGGRHVPRLSDESSDAGVTKECRSSVFSIESTSVRTNTFTRSRLRSNLTTHQFMFIRSASTMSGHLGLKHQPHSEPSAYIFEKATFLCS